MREQKQALTELVNNVHNVDNKREEHTEWHVLARILDRLFFVIYILSSIITSATFLGILSVNSWLFGAVVYLAEA